MAAYEPVIPEDIANIEPRVSALEESIYEIEIFQTVASGTTGNVAIPTGATIIPSQYAGPSNCFLATVSGGRPDDSAAIRANGDQVFCALALDGSFVFSNSPKTYPVAIVYQIAIKAKDIGNVPLSARTGEMTNGNASGVEYYNLQSGLNAANVQAAIDEEVSKRKITNLGTVTAPSYTENPDGTISIGSNGVFNFYVNSDFSGGLVTAVAPAKSNIALVNGQENYVHYDAATNSYLTTTNVVDLITNGKKVPVFRVSREGTSLHVLDYNSFGLGLSEKSFYKTLRTQPFDRVSGFVLQTAEGRISTITTGAAYFGIKLYSLGPNVSSTAGSLFEYYRTAGVWSSASVTSYDSSYYDDGASRQTLSSNKWVAKYFYRGIENDNHAYYIHGRQYNTITDAINEAAPTPPALLQNHSIYVGKIVIQQGATNGTAYPRAWEGAVISAGAVFHDDLQNISLAGAGVTNGHITSSAQTIAGQKTFSDRTAFGATTLDHKLTIAGTEGVESSLLIKDTTNSKQAILRPVADGALLATGGSNAISIGRYSDPVTLAGYTEVARYTAAGLYGVNRTAPVGIVHVGHTGTAVSGQSTSTATTDNGIVIENTSAGITQQRSEVTSGGQPYDSDTVFYNQWYDGAAYVWREVARFTSGQLWGNGTAAPTHPISVVRNSTTPGTKTQPGLSALNTSTTAGDGTTSSNRAIARVAAGNGAVGMSLQASYESGGSFGYGCHIYIGSNYPLSFWTNNVIRGRWTAAGNFEADNYSKLGSDAPAIRVKELTGTTGAAQGNSVTVAHGLTGDKIIAIDAVVRQAANSGVPPEFTGLTGYQFSVYYGATDVTVKLSAANSANILSKSFSVFITYKQ